MTAPEVAEAALHELTEENRLLRTLLWVWHGCPPGVADSDELQCPGTADQDHGPIDFARDSAQSIQSALQGPSLRYIHAHQDDVCRHCGVTRWTWDASNPCSFPAHEWVTPGENPMDSLARQ